MSRLLTILLALLLLGAWLPLSTAEAAPAALPAEEAKEEPVPVPAATAAGEGADVSGAEPEGLEEQPIERLRERLGESLGETVEEIREGVQEVLEKPVAVADAAHGRISERVLSTGRWIDSFFADPRVENEVGKTRVKIRFSLFAEEEATTEYDVQANVRLDLPILEGRLHLLLAGDPEDDDDFQAITGREGVPPELTAADERISASLRYYLVRTLYQNISLRSGVRLRSGTPTLFLEPRYRHSVPLDQWVFRFTQRFIGFTDGTIGARTTLDLERQLRPPLFFRTTANGSWFSDEEGYFYSLGFSLFQPLNTRTVLVYSLENSFQTQPTHRLQEVVLSTRFRQQIWREWFYYEIAPQLSFPHEDDYTVTPGIFLRMEMLFGDYPKLPPPKVADDKG